ncbi:PEP-CTERM sorting domain-containing protein [Duganella sacchari]
MDASPIPEAATYAMLLDGLALVGVARRRTRHAQVVHKKAGLPNWQPCC